MADLTHEILRKRRRSARIQNALDAAEVIAASHRGHPAKRPRKESVSSSSSSSVSSAKTSDGSDWESDVSDEACESNAATDVEASGMMTNELVRDLTNIVSTHPLFLNLQKKVQSAQVNEKASRDAIIALQSLLGDANRRATAAETQNAALADANRALTTQLAAANERIRALEGPPQGPITQVPQEILGVLFSRLCLVDVLACERVCTQWRDNIRFWMTDMAVPMYCDVVNDEVVRDLTKFRNLRHLSLRRCYEVTQDSVPVIAARLPHLKTLDLYGCNVSDFAPLKALTALTALEIGASQVLHDTALEALSPQLVSLGMEWCEKFDGAGLTHIAHLTSLKHLRVDQNDFMHDFSMCVPSSLAPSLETVKFNRQHWFTDLSLASLAVCFNLREMHFHWVRFTGQGFSAFSHQRMPHLHTLVLSRCELLDDNGFNAMVNALPHIKNLTLTGRHNLTSNSLSAMERLVDLESLTLRCKPIVDDIGLADAHDTDRPGLFFLKALRLRYLRLIDCENISFMSIDMIADTQPETLESLEFFGLNGLILSSDLVPLMRLTKLTNFAAVLCSSSEEDAIQFAYGEGGRGIIFDVSDDDDDDDDANKPMDLEPLELPDISAPGPDLSDFQDIDEQLVQWLSM